MKGDFIIKKSQPSKERNIYADKSSLILDWLLRNGLNQKTFSIREVAKERKVSLGLVQRVFEILVFKGLLHASGLRTAKKFQLKKPEFLLKSWLDNYSLTNKCKLRTYSTGLLDKMEIMKVLKQSNLKKKIALALHAAAEAYDVKCTNLATTELYLLDPAIRPDLEQALALEPREKGYEVLLIEPYYKSLLSSGLEVKNQFNVAPTLLSFLDLYHFPLRGLEQAEFMAERLAELKKIYRKIK